MSTDAAVLASMIHSMQCNDGPECGRWAREPVTDHRQYYLDKAQVVMDRLEPEIGSANVALAVRVVLDELW